MALLIWIVVFLITVTVHEVCHGLLAYALGDPTAKEQGRLTLNPFKHLDPFWTVLLPGILFLTTGGRFMIGMAKPVPVNFARLRHPKRDMVWVALAGPLANVIFATILSSLFQFTHHVLFLYAVYFNLGLAVFNLLPIPPLDGSKVLMGLLPRKWLLAYLRTERFGFWIILALYFSGVLFKFLMPMINAFCRFLNVPLLNVT